MITNRENKTSDKRRDKLSGYFFDISKLFCGGLVVGGLTPFFNPNGMDSSCLLPVSLGILGTVIFAWTGYKILK